MKSDKREPLDFTANDATEPTAVAAAPDVTFEPIALAGEPDEALFEAALPDLALDEDFDLPEVELVEADPEPPLPTPTQSSPPTSPKALPAPSSIPAPRTPSSRLIYGSAVAASVLWAIMSVYAIGYQWPLGSVDLQPYRVLLLLIFALVPIGFFWIAAYGLRQGLNIAKSAQRASDLAEQVFQPALLGAAEANAAAAGVRQEIVALTAAAAQARADLLSLHETLAGETGRLSALSEGAVSSAHTLGDRIALERESLGGLSEALGERSREIGEAITRQAQMVAEASDLAQTQIGEAEAALAARATDLSGAAHEASQAAQTASDDLARQAARLETATLGVGDQVRSMEDTLTEQRAALVQVANEIRVDHEDFSMVVEAQRVQLTEALTQATDGVANLHEAAAAAATSLADLTEAAVRQAHEAVETAREERDLLAASALQSLGALSEAARFERESILADVERTLQGLADGVVRERETMEEEAAQRMAETAEAARAARQALEVEAIRSIETVRQAAESATRMAEAQHENARKKLEQLGETAFVASQRADAAVQARLDDASRLIAKSAELIDQASGKTAERIERATETARSTLTGLEGAVTEFERRLSQLPTDTAAKTKALQQTLSAGVESLLATARAAAEETQAIDAAFQERVRRNYEMLSEAVRLMGVVSNRPAGGASPRTAAGEAPLRRFGPAPAPTPALNAPVASAAPAPAASAPAAAEGLRPRLRLSPTTADSEVSQAFEGAGQTTSPAGAGSEGADWTWQELLSSMDDSPVDERQLIDRLLGEIEGLGVDPAAFLPTARIAEIAAVQEAGDADGVRAIVRRLAPTAVRRLSRRMFAEKGLRAHVERFVGDYEEQIRKLSALPTGGREAVLNLLASDEGRAFLLFRTALGDLG